MVELGDRRVLQPGRLRWLRAVGWMVLLFFAVGILFAGTAWAVQHAMTAIAGLPPSQSKQLPGWFKVIGMAVVLAITVGGYLLAVRFGEDRPRPAEWDVSRFLPEWLAGLGVGFVLMAVTVGIMALAGFVTLTPAPVRTISTALVDTLQSGTFEELLLRLVVFRLLWRAFGAWWALGLSALLFGALHLANPNASWFAAICIAFEAGIMLAAFYMLTGRIWASIGVHMGWNFTQGWIFGAAVSGTSGFAGGPLTTTPKASVADWLDGGGFGPEAALPALLICTAAGLWVLRRAWLQGQFAPEAPRAL
ncbi:lysostaphin resistance A-like protein [Sphingomonas sp.]|uniref:CPBP family intramembrane glutamic endopeptidase n=1 Tax=Sphingomonas sp. TaxID=28214 RepID=UPI003CC652AC